MPTSSRRRSPSPATRSRRCASSTLVARIERGRPIRLDDLVDRLNATHLDWLFTRAVVADALIALQANWMADYRNSSGIVLDDGPYGDDPHASRTRAGSIPGSWARRSAPPPPAARALDEFARRDRVAGG